MAIRMNRSVIYYLRRKHLQPTPAVPAPKYELATLHPHLRPVTVRSDLRPVDSPANKILTMPW